MTGALLHDSGAPAGKLCTSSSLWVWPWRLCVGLGFWSAARSMAAPSGTTAGASGPLLHGPLPGSSGTTATSAHGLLLGCSVATAAGSHELLLVPSGTTGARRPLPVPSSTAVPGTRCHSPTSGPVCRGPRQLGAQLADCLVPVRGFRAALPPRGLGCLKFPGIPSCWLSVPGQLCPAVGSLSL